MKLFCLEKDVYGSPFKIIPNFFFFSKHENKIEKNILMINFFAV